MSSQVPFTVNVVPPSPEAAALAKYADVPVSLYSGIPRISIPLYELKERDLNVPILLNYHASAHKVEDEASRVGLGWSVSAGGIVTRSIRGLPDEYAPGGFLHQAAEMGHVGAYALGSDAERYRWYDAMARGCRNAEPDLFYFNFAGYSGMFQFDWDGTIVVASEVKLRVTPVGLAPNGVGFIQGWEIITPDGLRWEFSISESTSTRYDGADILADPCRAILEAKRPPQTWHLAKIVSPFTQSHAAFEYTDYSQTLQRWSLETITHNEHLSPGSIAREKMVSDVAGKHLSRITTSSADTTIVFVPGQDRTDVTGSALRTLAEIRVLDRHTQVVKAWTFEYDYRLGRLTLVSLQERGGGGRVKPPFTFSYYGGNLPGALSFRQDHWGYWNNNPRQSLVPTTVAARSSGDLVNLDGADRSSEPGNLTVGMLKEILYPTGGKDAFEFEPHEYSFEQDEQLRAPVTIDKHISGSAPASDTPPGQEHIERTPFNVTANTELVLTMLFTYGMRFSSGLFLPVVAIEAGGCPTDQNWANEHLRVVADVGIVGFGIEGVWTALSNGDGTYQPARLVLGEFGYNQGWRVDQHPRFLADLTGDGRADIVGFGIEGVWTALSNGDGTYQPARLVLGEFGYHQGWRVDQHPRFLADLTGDGRADIVGFGIEGVWTALNNGDGTYQPARLVLGEFGYNQGWRVDQHPRFLADPTGDGRADIVGFGIEGVWTALSNGDGTYQPARLVLGEFGYNQGWRVDQHPRFLADPTGDGRADIVGFGIEGVWTALSNGDGTYQPARLVLGEFGYNQGWRVDQHPRFLADPTGDGRADIVGFGNEGVWTALSNGDGTYQPARLVLGEFGYHQGWRVDQHPRFLADPTGDGRADIVGFGNEGVWTALSNGDGSFQPARFVLRDFGATSNSTRREVYRLALGGSAQPDGQPTHEDRTQVFNPRTGNAAASNLPPERLPAGSYLFVVRGKAPAAPQLGRNSVSARLAWKAPTGEIRTRRVQGAGTRISTITRSYGFGNPDKVTKYQYTMDIDGEEVSSGSLLESYYVYEKWTTYLVLGEGPTIPTSTPVQKFVRFSQNRSALGTTHGSHVGYSKVAVLHGSSAENGRTVYTFTSPIDFPDLPDLEVPFAPAISNDYARGLLKEQAEYRSGGSVPVRQVTNTYAFVQHDIWGLKVGWNVPGDPPFGPGYLDRYAVKGYANVLGYARLVERDERLHEAPDSFVTHAAYEYAEAGHKQLVRKSLTTSSGMITTEYRYPSDYPPGTSTGIDELEKQHVAGVVVEEARYRSDGAVVSAQRTRYGLFNGTVHPTDIEVAAIGNQVLGGGGSVFDAVKDLYEVRFTYHAYDSSGNILEVSRPGGMVTSFIWDASRTQLVAKVDNARRRQIAYYSFEDNLLDSEAGQAYMGLRSKMIDGPYEVAGSELPQVSGDYILSYWRLVPPATAWTRVETIIRDYIPGTGIVTDPINGYLDEVRLHPLHGVMTSFACSPLVGLQSSADANGLVTYFEYDAFGRLTTVLDHNHHIRTHHQYAFGRDLGSGDPSQPSHIRTHKALVAGIETIGDLIGAEPRRAQQTTLYLDLMARAIQTVQRGASPTGNDLVEISAYDGFDREETTFLPFVTDTTDGEYTAIDPTKRLLLDFYSSQDPEVPKSSAPFAHTLFDRSPLNRIVETGAPGEAWQPNATSESHTRQFEYRANAEADAVLDLRLIDGEVRTHRAYPAGTLRAEFSIDEHDGRVGLFYDSEGRETLRSVETSIGEQTRMYFLYDHKGNLVVVIPPRAADQLTRNPADAQSPTRIDPKTVHQECYRYSYDLRNRLVEKALPGAETEFMVYDRWDRLTMSQDGNQRRTNTWTFSKYDAHDRLVMSGEIIIEGARTEIAEAVDEFYATAAEENRFEIAGNHHGYSNRSFPQLDASARVDRVAYFDDYSFVSTLPAPSSYAFHPESSVTERLRRPVGQATGSKLRVFPTNHFVSSVTYYDTYYHPVQIISDAPIGGRSRQTTEYNFVGNVSRSLETLEPAGASVRVERQYAYDHAQRVQRVLLALDDGDAVGLFALHYNEVGQLVRKQLHSDGVGDTFAARIDYRYNIRGWPVSIGSASLEQPGDSGGLFAMNVSYEETLEQLSTVPQFNGNVSAVRWRNAHINEEQAYVYTYDGFDRLAAARYRTTGPKDGAFDVCGFVSGGIDAALYSGSKTYFFSGTRYIRVTRGDTGPGTVDPGYPAPISAWGWPSGFGTDGIDAALYSGSKTYFFSGTRYIRVTRGDTGPGTVDPGYPAPISAWGWPSGFGTDGIDAALYSRSKTYFFSGTRYIRVTRGDTGPGTVDPGYPAPISAWGWPSGFGTDGIDAALYSGSKTYFFSGTRYIRVTRGDTGPGTVDPGYPAPTSAWGWPSGFGTDGIDAEAAVGVIEYDPNGNLSTLSRHAFISSQRVEVDRLVYEYGGNQLTRVQDLSGHSDGFHDAGAASTRYQYDFNGNMIIDRNSGLDISYNPLNLVEQVTKQSGEWVRFGFDAAGQKRFRETSGAPNTPSTRIDYFGDYVFEDGVLRVLRHNDGQIVWDSEAKVWRHQYFVHDYLGNVRVAFEVEPEQTQDRLVFHTTIIQIEDYYPFGLRFDGNEVEGAGGSAIKHLFGGKELQDVIGLDWYDFGARMLDPAIGRWFVLDPDAEKSPSITPYGYAFNNPIRYIDLDGRQALAMALGPSGWVWGKIRDLITSAIIWSNRDDRGWPKGTPTEQVKRQSPKGGGKNEGKEERAPDEPNSERTYSTLEEFTAGWIGMRTYTPPEVYSLVWISAAVQPATHLVGGPTRVAGEVLEGSASRALVPVVAIALWAGTKWVVAVVLAPPTSGASIRAAAALP